MGQTFPTMAELSARMQAEAAELPNQPVKLRDGWTFVPPFGTMGFAVLVRESDGKNFRASADSRLWEKQILDFEFKDGAQWTDEQIAAMRSKAGAPIPSHLPPNPIEACFSGCACLRCVGVVKPGTQVAVPNQAVHLGADGVCIHGQSETCAEGFRRLGLDNKTPWMALPAAEILMTDEMLYKVRHGASRAVCGLTDDQIREVYRAMRPLEPPDMLAQWNKLVRDDLIDRNTALLEAVPFIRGGHYDAADSERYGCHLIWWPDELRPPFFEGDKGSRTLHMSCPTSGMPTYYDIGYDERRPITQAILDKMESGIQRLFAEHQEIHAAKDAEIALLRQALAMKDARIGELKSVLASTPVAFEDPDARPEPASNPFREFPRDMRKMGP